MNCSFSTLFEIFDLICMSLVLFMFFCNSIKIVIDYKNFTLYSLITFISLIPYITNNNILIRNLLFIIISIFSLKILLSISFKYTLIPYMINFCIYYSVNNILDTTLLLNNAFGISILNNIYLSSLYVITIPLSSLLVFFIFKKIFHTNSFLEHINSISTKTYYLIVSFSVVLLCTLICVNPINQSFIQNSSHLLLYALNLTAILLVITLITYIRQSYQNLLLNIENNSLIQNIKDIEALNEDLRSTKHDFFNHLQVVSGLLQLKKHTECFDYISNISNRGTDKKCIKTGLISVNALLNSKQLHANHNNVKLDLEIESTLDNEHLKIEDWEITRVLGNLIDNAIFEENKVSTFSKYVKVKINENNHFYNLSVYNKNSYIGSDKKKKIFNSGYSTKGDQGSGMGLYIVNKIVNKHNGYLELNSDINTGTQFNIYLPKENKQIDIPQASVSYPPQESFSIQN